MSALRIRIGLHANGADCLVSLSEDGGDVLKSGTFALADLDAASPTRAEMRAAVEELSTSPIFEAAGRKLFDALASAGVAEPWMGRHEAHERTFLELDESLSDLPWELLRGTVPGKGPRRFFMHPPHAIARWHRDQGRALAESPVLRVLVVTGERATGETSLVGQEIASIKRAFQACDQGAYLEVLEQPATPDDLDRRLRELRPHVLHFVGHGGVSLYTGHPGLLFGPVKSPLWWWDTDAIFGGFDGLGWAPRLVVINACHSGQVGDASRDISMASVAGAFARSGVLAVVGLQATVRQDLAARFSGAFYHQLADGKQVDRVCAEVRPALANFHRDGTGFLRRDWALPVLSVACDPRRVLPIHQVADRLRTCPALGVFFARKGPSPFVDRSDQRRQVLSAFDPFADGERASPCVIVTGPEGTGKSWLSRRCSRDLAHAGAIVRHCDLSQGTGLTFVDVLRQIVAGDPQQPDSMIHQPLPAAHFADFEARAAENAGKLQDTAVIRRVGAAFRQGLLATAAGSSLLLVLDHLAEPGRGSVQPEEFKLSLLPELVKPVAAGTVDRVRLVLIGTQAEVDAFGLTRANLPAARFVTLDNFAAGDYVGHFYEYCRYQGGPNLEVIRDYWRLKLVKNDSWSPALFRKLDEDVAGLLP